MNPTFLLLIVVGSIEDEKNSFVRIEFLRIDNPATLDRLSVVPGSSHIPLLRKGEVVDRVLQFKPRVATIVGDPLIAYGM